MANKFTSGDGRKTWYTFSGEYKGDLWYYGFLYMPLYLSTGAVDIYEAEAATLTGARAASGYPGCSGSGYIENFARPGDRAVFDLNNVHGAGWHIVRIRYTSPKVNGNVMSIYVNGRKAKRVKFSENGSDCPPGLDWTDRSDIYFLNHGANAFEIRRDQGDSAAGLMIDYLAVSREPTYDEGVNIAPESTATASSGEPARAVRGCALDEASQWSAAGEGRVDPARLGRPEDHRHGPALRQAPHAGPGAVGSAGLQRRQHPARGPAAERRPGCDGNRLPAQNGDLDQADHRQGQQFNRQCRPGQVRSLRGPPGATGEREDRRRAAGRISL